MADKKIQPTNPAADAKKAEDPKVAELAGRKTASFHIGRKSGRKTNQFRIG